MIFTNEIKYCKQMLSLVDRRPIFFPSQFNSESLIVNVRNTEDKKRTMAGSNRNNSLPPTVRI